MEMGITDRLCQIITKIYFPTTLKASLQRRIQLEMAPERGQAPRGSDSAQSGVCGWLVFCFLSQEERER